MVIISSRVSIGRKLSKFICTWKKLVSISVVIYKGNYCFECVYFRGREVIRKFIVFRCIEGGKMSRVKFL